MKCMIITSYQPDRFLESSAFLYISITGFLITTTFNFVIPIFSLFLNTLDASAALIGLIFRVRYVEQIFLQFSFGSTSARQSTASGPTYYRKNTLMFPIYYFSCLRYQFANFFKAPAL
jgi:hypothetical protein